VAVIVTVLAGGVYVDVLEGICQHVLLRFHENEPSFRKSVDRKQTTTQQRLQTLSMVEISIIREDPSTQ
jgi:hypothetical protein